MRDLLDTCGSYLERAVGIMKLEIRSCTAIQTLSGSTYYAVKLTKPVMIVLLTETVLTFDFVFFEVRDEKILTPVKLYYLRDVKNRRRLYRSLLEDVSYPIRNIAISYSGTLPSSYEKLIKNLYNITRDSFMLHLREGSINGTTKALC